MGTTCSLTRQMDEWGRTNPSETSAIAIIALTMPWKIVQNKNEILPERSMFNVITEHDNNTVREASQYTAHTLTQVVLLAKCCSKQPQLV